MKLLGQVAAAFALILAALWVAASVLPKLLPTAAAIVGLVILTRLVFYFTHHDGW